jgi:hypothetical protein
MRKILFQTSLLFIGIAFISGGCNSANSTDKAPAKIPFMAYCNEKGNKVVAKMAFWDLKNSNVKLSNKSIYEAKPNEYFDSVNPKYWDGDKRLVLNEISAPSPAYKKQAKVEKNNEDLIYGRNIKAERFANRTDGLGRVTNYRLFLYDSRGVTKKNTSFLFKTKDEKGATVVVGEDDYPSMIDYDPTTGAITFIFKYFFETHTSIYAAKCNVKNLDKKNWEEVILAKEIETGGNYTPYPVNSVLIDDKYYIQSHLSFAEVDFRKKESRLLDDMVKECKGLVKEGGFEPGYPKDILPIGVYKNSLILDVQVSTDIDIEHLICAYRNNEFAGAIHIKNNRTWEVIDSNKKTTAKINVKNKNLYREFGTDFLVFPSAGSVF